MPHWTDFVAGGENIYEDLASSGTTSPSQTTVRMKKEKGFVSMRVLLQGTTTAERAPGSVMLISDNAAAGTGFEGATASAYVNGETGLAAFAGVLAHTLLTADAADEWEVAQLQMYGYFKDAFTDGGVSANESLVPDANLGYFDTFVAGTDDRAVAVALEDDSGTAAISTCDVFLFGA